LDACLDRLLPSTSSTGLMLALQEAPLLTEPGSPAQHRGGAMAAHAQARPEVDWEALLDSIDGDVGFARELVGAFVGTADRELAAIATALGTGDAATMRESAHTLKGTSANLRASAAASAAAQLESAARLGQTARMPALAEGLTAEIRGAIVYLKSKVS
jgi:HPt (histidine-containing phosphotransfer) domain-containing protein